MAGSSGLGLRKGRVRGGGAGHGKKGCLVRHISEVRSSDDFGSRCLG
jgi:hypothetical protein